MRLVRPLVIALLMLLMAVTPLSALIAPGEFEVRFRRDESAQPFEPYGFTVRLKDRTGLVRALSPWVSVPGIQAAVTNQGADGRLLVVEWDGSSCDSLSRLTFDRAGHGFLIRVSTDEVGCFIGSGASHAVGLHLWAPVDAATVTLASE